MRFMNEYEIDDRARQYREHPILGPATRTLEALKDCANHNSDGWCYWLKPSRAAAKLMEMVERDGTARYAHGDRDDVTAAEYRRALSPIKAFRTRTGLDFQIEELPKDTA